MHMPYYWSEYSIRLLFCDLICLALFLGFYIYVMDAKKKLLNICGFMPEHEKPTITLCTTTTIDIASQILLFQFRDRRFNS
ncbi:hypothetical protein DERF_011562 [Dermatophagoides farinae]|uniref:Uncharacterized protein n=1 Tax=Dermatophagoides farinae TaxID=6954 RepID=A0A922HT68_DERFA|nr:hypothetical protein DERF_011562 [Dermatophagoides farinae]